MTGELNKGTLLGRYIVLGRLGAGGMGVVYTAYDPDLNRRVALKIMQPQSGGSGGAQARMLREAQALARLSHPNVVVVYDVGSVGDRVFLAMELVEGDTLSGWLKQPRTWWEIIAAFVAAGRGLDAAHAAGVIHRDFKPGNVLVGTDGRVRVMDFGLARAGDDIDERRELGSGRDALTEDLTETGSVMGTPLYMPPEAYRAQLVGEAGDQFSFCVALYDALYRQRPFDTAKPPTDDARWRVRPPPRTTQVPRRIHELVVKGLAHDPRARHASVKALVEALEYDPSVRRRRVAIGMSVAAIAATGIALVSFGDGSAAQCRGAQDKLAGIWDAPRKEAIRRAFVAGNAAESFTRVMQLLDGYAREWADMHTESCQATRVRGEQSEEVLTLRMMCLERRRTDFAALAGVLEGAKRDAISRAVQSAHELPPLERCADVAALRAPIPPPEDSVARGRVDQLYNELARARTARDVAGLEKVAAAATKLAWSPLVAEAELAYAQALARDSVETAAASVAFERALVAAVRANDDRALAEAMRGQVQLIPSPRLAAEAPTILARLEALTTRLGDDALTSRALITAAQIEQRLDHVPRAIELAKRAIALCEKRFGPLALQTAEAHESLSRILQRVGRTADAEPHARRALDGKRRALGSRHADLIPALTRMAAVADANGRREEAYELQHEATVIAEAAFGPEHEQVAIALLNESAQLAALRRFDEAIALADRMRRIRANLGAASEHWIVMDHLAYADLMLKTGRDDRAADELAAALAIAQRGGIANDMYAGVVVATLANLAFAQERLGRHRESRATLDRMLRLPEGTTATTRTKRVDALIAASKWHLVHGEPRVALRWVDEAKRVAARAATTPERWAIDISTCRGRSYLALGRADAALAELERAMQRLSAPTRPYGPGVKFALARAIVESRGDRQRALALAREARAERDRYLTLASDYPAIAEIDDWLAKQERP